ncbi:hypothetical protein DY000_02033105 [Brassica cretica]|uniref:Leucine-rich repeat-containing N-terminal plant-type domain-containing protein n=1 Tax=Brassica cretica TaxID=69181 RepID=A0ABQ7DSK5_BRACR|nr:hypothetical protein DY000_02033105 [Brassica cretica]
MLDISSNTFQNPFPLLPVSLMYFSCSDNRFSGEISREICKLVYLDTLVLSNNNFNGSIPRCFENFNTTLSVLNLRNNSISGVFPEESIGAYLQSLDVGHNKISGELPKSLINCTRLEFLNVEDNIFNDKFPFWLRLLPNLQILVLRSNQFHGKIFSFGASLIFPKLRIFDISRNLFTGVLPSDYFAGWSAMSSDVGIVDSTPVRILGRGSGFYHRSVALTNKGLNMELVGSGFKIYKSIDVSGNRIEGDIPISIGLLKELIVLNMSNNVFTGGIPPSLASLTNLQSLDLSQNRLSGEIPPELGKLTFLARMNFSYNMLEGPIPQGTQIQSQNSSSFAENPGLCGFPLEETCGGKEEEATKQEEDGEKEEKHQVISWISAAIGYLPGVLALGENNFNGPIPRFISKLVGLWYLDLALWNTEKGKVDFSIFLHLKSLTFLDLSYINTRSRVDLSLFSDLMSLGYLDLSGINLKVSPTLHLLSPIEILTLSSCNIAEFPKFLETQTSLSYLDISSNQIKGQVPKWLWRLPLLRFEGRDSGNLYNSVSMTAKGLVMELVGSGFTIYKTIDVSGNKLQGDIPESISLLKELIVLNMSNNAFTGHISPSLENLTNLQSLDLSQNRLSGEIPPELGKLTFLARMNFSYNMLEGLIPQGTQIQSQSSSSFAQNPMLCGVPLQETCGRGDNATTQEQEDEDGEKDQVLSWVAAAIGYVPGVFCGVVIGHILSSYKRDWFMKIFHSFA